MKCALTLLIVLATTTRAADWQLQVVDADSLGYYPSLKIAPDGQPAIAHYDGGLNGVRFSRFNGSVWSNTVVENSGYGWYTSLAFNPTNGQPAIAHYDNGNLDLRYSSFNGSAWTTTVVDSIGDVGSYCSLAFDTNGLPAISYVEFNGYPSNNLKFARHNGTDWVISTLVSNQNVSWTVPLAFNPTNGHPAIAYVDYIQFSLHYIAYDGSGWLSSTVATENVGTELSLAFRSDGYPVIAYDGNNSAIRHARFNGSSWVLGVVTGNSPAYVSMDLKLDGDPVFSYYSAVSSDLWFTERINGEWIDQLVDPGSLAGTDSSVGFDTNGLPIIAYRHGGLNQLWFARRLAVPPSSVDGTNAHLYGANIGWINARGDVTNGLRVGAFFCEGRLWSANCGWIGFGNRPTNGWQYGNVSADDYGVNVERSGALRGRGYGANIGWIRFETNGNPRVDRFTGNLSGYAWGANVGWISLSNLYGFARTDTLDPGPDLDSDGLPDAWELSYSGDITNLTAAGDADADGVPDAAEYLADTDPLDDGSLLEITALNRVITTNVITWTVEPTRTYRLEQSGTATNDAVWSDSGLGVLPPGAGPTLTGLVPDPAATAKFYRAKAVVPLVP